MFFSNTLLYIIFSCSRKKVGRGGLGTMYGEWSMVYSALVADNFFTKCLSREQLLVLSESHEYQFQHFLTVQIE